MPAEGPPRDTQALPSAGPTRPCRPARHRPVAHRRDCL